MGNLHIKQKEICIILIQFIRCRRSEITQSQGGAKKPFETDAQKTNKQKSVRHYRSVVTMVGKNH